MAPRRPLVTSQMWPLEPEERRQAGRRPFECELPGTPEEFAAMVDQGRRRGWPEVVRAGLYGLLRHAAEPAGRDPRAQLQALMDASEHDGDPDMLALALAWRAWLAVAAGLDTGAVPEDDLARAVVILETEDGNPVVRATAHFRLAFSFLSRCLWELADEQFASAELMVDAVDPLAKDPLLHRAALAYDRALVQLDWGCAVREVAGPAGARHRRETQEVLIAAADCVDMPSAWRRDVRLAGLVLDVVAGAARTLEVRAHLDDIERTGQDQAWAGYLHLALALCPEVIGLGMAAEEADRAIATIDAKESPAPYNLALYQATVLEAAAGGRRTAGLRSAEELATQRERGRQTSLAAMRTAIASERLRKERDVLAHHAYVDPLTGLENRRGFDRRIAALRTAGVEQVAVLLFDVDDFKRVNDSLGHPAGDTVLRRIADILTANVRSGDFAARLGGDEFVLLLAGSGGSATKRGDAIAAEINAQVWRDLGADLQVSVSVGVATGHPSAIDALGQQADVALYRAKAGRDQLTSSY